MGCSSCSVRASAARNVTVVQRLGVTAGRLLPWVACMKRLRCLLLSAQGGAPGGLRDGGLEVGD